MTPASNSEARKRAEAPAPTVLVEMPTGFAEVLVRPHSGDAYDAALETITDLIAAALDARVPATSIGDRVRPDAAPWTGRH